MRALVCLHARALLSSMVGFATSGAFMKCVLVGEAASVWFLPVIAEHVAFVVNEAATSGVTCVGGAAIP